VIERPKLSVIVPFYNEAESIRPLYEAIVQALAELGVPFEMVFVDDGSKDDTLERATAIARADPRVRIVKFRRNYGQTPAMAAGIEQARGEILVTMDGDLQNDPADIPRLLAELERGADVVSGVRVDRHDSWTRRASSKIANAVRNWATDERITDVGCSLKAYRAEYLEHLPMFTGMHRFLPTLVRWQGARVAELPVRHRARRHGVGKYGIGNRLFRALADLVAVRWMRTRWINPRNHEEIRP
jgi:glycosyltransferase involved in cell wall biosynthesis